MNTDVNAIVTLADLTQMRDEIVAGNEAFNGAAFGDRFIAGFRNFVYGKFRWNQTAPTPLSVKQISNTLKNHNYLDMEKEMLHIPAGFSGNLGKYVEHIDLAVVPFMVNLGEVALPNTGRWVDSIISNPDDWRREYGFDDPELYGKDAPKVEHVLEAEGTYFIQGNRRTEDYFQKLVYNNQEYIDLCDKINKINGVVYSKYPPEAIEKLTKRVVNVTDGLIKRSVFMKNSSAKMREHVSNNLLKTAHMVEAYTALLTHLMELNVCLEYNQAKLLSER